MFVCLEIASVKFCFYSRYTRTHALGGSKILHQWYVRHVCQWIIIKGHHSVFPVGSGVGLNFMCHTQFNDLLESAKMWYKDDAHLAHLSGNNEILLHEMFHWQSYITVLKIECKPILLMGKSFINLWFGLRLSIGCDLVITWLIFHQNPLFCEDDPWVIVCYEFNASSMILVQMSLRIYSHNSPNYHALLRYIYFNA